MSLELIRLDVIEGLHRGLMELTADYDAMQELDDDGADEHEDEDNNEYNTSSKKN